MVLTYVDSLLLNRARLRSGIYLSVSGLTQGTEKLKVMAQILFAFPCSGYEVQWLLNVQIICC